MDKNRFNLVAKLFQKGAWPFVNDYLEDSKCKSPMVVDLDLTTFCDLACPECISNPILNTKSFKGNETLQLTQEIIDLGIKAVILIGGGEPLLHRDASKVITMLGEANIKLGLVTNGTLIHTNLEAISKYVSWTRVSVDSGSESTFNSFRPAKKNGSAFNQVIQNMRLLATHKKGDLGYSFLLMTRPNGESNSHEIELAGRLAKDIGCDYFELKTMFDPGHRIIAQESHVIEGAKTQLAALREIEDQNFRVFDAFTFKELVESEDKENYQVKNYETCPVSELRSTITPNGIYPCAYHRNNPEMKIGDFGASSLKEIWDNKQKIVNPSIECNFECARHSINLEVFRLKTSKTDVKLDDDFDLFI